MAEKRLNVSINEDLHREMKKTAVSNDMTIIELVTEAIEEKIERLNQPDNKES